jgi:hypothetical protein
MAFLGLPLLVGCGTYVETPMHKAASDPRKPRDGEALVIFVRPTDDYWNLPVAIATPKGEYVAGLGTKQHVAVPVPPGKHAYFAFINDNPAAAVVVEAEAGKVYFVRTSLTGAGARIGPGPQPNQVSQNPTSRTEVAANNGATMNNAALGAMSSTAPPAYPHLDPLGVRFGQSREVIDKLLQNTEAREVDVAVARKFEQENGGGPLWRKGIDTGNRAVSSTDEATLDSMTLHGSDGF